jgi:hypothetical protein
MAPEIAHRQVDRMRQVNLQIYFFLGIVIVGLSLFDSLIRLYCHKSAEAYPSLFFLNEYFPLQQDEAYWARRSRDYGFSVIVFNHRDRSWASEDFIVRRVFDPARGPGVFRQRHYYLRKTLRT